MEIGREKVVLAAVVLAAALGALLVDRLIVTDAERVESAIRAMAEAVSRSDMEAVFTHVSEEYADPEMPLPALRALAEAFFRSHDRTLARVRDVEVQVGGGLATAMVAVMTRNERGDLYGGSLWQVEFVEEGDGAWRVTRVIPLRFRGREVNGWEDVREAVGFWGGGSPPRERGVGLGRRRGAVEVSARLGR